MVKRTCNAMQGMLIYKCPKGGANKFQSSMVVKKKYMEFPQKGIDISAVMCYIHYNVKGR